MGTEPSGVNMLFMASKQSIHTVRLQAVMACISDAISDTTGNKQTMTKELDHFLLACQRKSEKRLPLLMLYTAAARYKRDSL